MLLLHLLMGYCTNQTIANNNAKKVNTPPSTIFHVTSTHVKEVTCICGICINLELNNCN